MIFTEIKDLKYSREDFSTIDLLATCKEYGEIPMTLNLIDREDLHLFDTGTFETVIENEEEVKNPILVPLEDYCISQKIAPYVAPEVIIAIPTSITMRQARLHLLDLDLLDDVEVLVSQDKRYQIEWEYANEVLRNSPLISAMQTSLNLSDEEIDNMFINASKI